MLAGIDDCYTSARGCTATRDNFAKATFDAISKAYSDLTSYLWETVHQLSLSGIHSFCENPHQKLCSEDSGSSYGYHIRV
ncbi:rCG47566, partial [Rattus norvegicus]